MIGMIYLYKILSLGFSYPEKDSWAMIEKQFTMSEGLFKGDLASMLNSLKQLFNENIQRIDDFQSEYLAIFDVGRQIAPYETEYMTEKVSRKPFELADIAGFYKAFGFCVNENRRNKEAFDHIAIELEFMAILSWKEEYAKEKKQSDNLRIVQDARMKFLKEHLANWGFFFCRRIYGLGGDGLYPRLAEILEFVLNSECDRYEIDTALFDRELHSEPYSGVRSEELTCSN